MGRRQLKEQQAAADADRVSRSRSTAERTDAELVEHFGLSLIMALDREQQIGGIRGLT
jgi:hypothetical protein